MKVGKKKKNLLKKIPMHVVTGGIIGFFNFVYIEFSCCSFFHWGNIMCHLTMKCCVRIRQLDYSIK